jgi:hypothetical protein
MERKKSVANYLGENAKRVFKIPAYQRGYKWGVSYQERESAVTILCKDILAAMQNQKAEYFIQGVTVYETIVKFNANNNVQNIVLIDGQQRTTTLFILLNLLCNEEEKKKYLFLDGQLKLQYKIRESSHTYLEKICKNESVENLPKTQDIYYFSAANNQIIEIIEALDVNVQQQLKEYILNNVMLFYIVVPEEQAANVFSMMNGAKAFMKTDELVKASFLSEASKNTHKISTVKTIKDSLSVLTDQIGADWQANALRSQYARQWDKWLYWWNKKEVQIFFKSSNNPLGLLLAYFYENDKDSIKQTKIAYTNDSKDIAVIFKSFQNLFIKDKERAVLNFEKLRKLQKKFEDLFNSHYSYNYLGLILETNSDKKSRENAIRFFIENFKEKEILRRYALLKLLGKTYKHSNTYEQDEELKEAVINTIDSISTTDVYNEIDSNKGVKELTFKMLLKLNVEAANGRDVKFDFYVIENNALSSFYSKRSLEHIWPKSKIALKRENGSYFYIDGKGNENNIKPQKIDNYIKREDLEKENLSEHHIGNLVLLHKTDNSKFSASLPEDKKKLYFDLEKELLSRNLLHSMSVFAYDSWSVNDAIKTIKQNQKEVIKKIKLGYEDYIN